MNLEQLKKALVDQGLPGVTWCDHPRHAVVIGPRGEVLVRVAETPAVPEFGSALVLEGRFDTKDGLNQESFRVRSVAEALIVLRRLSSFP